MKIVQTNEEAEAFFLSNSTGDVVCQRSDGEAKECSCYPDAVTFLESNQ